MGGGFQDESCRHETGNGTRKIVEKGGLQPLFGYALHGTQGGHDQLVVGIGGGKEFLLMGRFADRGNVLADIGHIPTAAAATEGVGGSAHAQIGRAVPVAAVVARAAAWAAEVGNFVLLKPCLRGPLEQGLIVRQHHLLVGREQASLGHLAMQDGALLNGEGVCRKVADGQGRELLQVGLPAGEGLAGEAIDEVEADVAEACFGSGLHGLERLLGAVAAVEQVQVVVEEGLHPDAEAVEEMHPDESLKKGRREVLGVGLKGDLLQLREVETAGNGVHQLTQLVEGEERRSAATKVDGMQGMGLLGTAQLQLAAEGIDIGLLAARGDGRVESAVGALAVAEGYVQVEHGRDYWREVLSNWSAA